MERRTAPLSSNSFTSRVEFERGSATAELTLGLGKTAMEFSRIERTPRYADVRRESDVEHSFMLSLVAPEIAVALELDLDLGLIAQYANVHDLIELHTSDIATFLFDAEDQRKKEADEQFALAELIASLPIHTARMLAQYEEQADAESRFVRYVDKLLPLVVDIVGAGEKVMREDYGVSSIDELRDCHKALQERLRNKFGDEFPDITLAHQLLCELFEYKFSESEY